MRRRDSLTAYYGPYPNDSPLSLNVKVRTLRPDQHATELMNVTADGGTRSEIGLASEVVGCTHVLHCEFQHGSDQRVFRMVR